MVSDEDKRLEEYYLGRLALAKRIVNEAAHVEDVPYTSKEHAVLTAAVFEKLAKGEYRYWEDLEREERKAKWEAQKAATEAAKAKTDAEMSRGGDKQ
jgi:hypothetical protein